jgi:hypothetical protein
MPKYTEEESKAIDKGRAILDNLSVPSLQDGTVIIFLPYTIQIYLPDNTRLIYNVDFAFTDKVNN